LEKLYVSMIAKYRSKTKGVWHMKEYCAKGCCIVLCCLTKIGLQFIPYHLQTSKLLYTFIGKFYVLAWSTIIIHILVSPFFLTEKFHSENVFKGVVKCTLPFFTTLDMGQREIIKRGNHIHSIAWKKKWQTLYIRVHAIQES